MVKYTFIRKNPAFHLRLGAVLMNDDIRLLNF